MYLKIDACLYVLFEVCCKKYIVSENNCLKKITVLFIISHQAIDSRDSVAMALYSQCFSWVIKKINSRIKGKDDFKSIGILDIFGFENFEVCFKHLFRWQMHFGIVLLTPVLELDKGGGEA